MGFWRATLLGTGLVVLLAAGAARAEVLSSGRPAQWSGIRPSVVPDRESIVGTDFKKAPEGCGAVDPRAVVVRLASRTHHMPVADALVDCPSGDIMTGMVLKLDFTCSRNFTGENVVTLPLISDEPNVANRTYAIRGDDVPVTIDGETYRVHFGGGYPRFSGDRYMWIHLGMARKGQITVDGRECDIYFCEADGNLSVTDRTPKDSIFSHRQLHDVVLITAPDDREDVSFPAALALYGEPVAIGGAVYAFTLDENKVPVVEKLDRSLGRIHLDQKRWRMNLADGRHVIFVCGNDGPVDVPAGEYGIYRIDVATFLDEAREQRVSLLADLSEPAAMTVRTGQTVEVPLDDLFKPELTVARSGQLLCFSATGSGAYRRFFTKGLEKTGVEVGAAVLELSTSEGKVLYRHRDSEAVRSQFTHQVKIHPEWPGKIVATLSWYNAPMMKPAVTQVELDRVDGQLGGF